MSEPCEHQKDEAAWIWAQQLRFVADERDAALAEVERLRISLAWVRDHADGLAEIIDGSNFKTPRNLHVAVKDLRTVVRADLGQQS